MRLYIIFLCFVGILFSCKENSSRIQSVEQIVVEPEVKEVIIEQPAVIPEPAEKEIILDKILSQLNKSATNEEIQACQEWLKIQVSRVEDELSSSMYTNRLKKYLAELPDDIMIDMEPEAYEKFKRKWKKIYDINQMDYVHPLSTGNGGCMRYVLKNSEYLGNYFNDILFKVNISCDGSSQVKRIFRIIKNENKYLVDGIYNN